jgi:mRNA interferase MazF
MAEVRRGDIVLVIIDPTIGSETAKTRPCLVVSPDEMNLPAPTVIVVPLTTKNKPYPWRVDCVVGDQPGQVMPEQIRTISKDRVLRVLASADRSVLNEVLDRLAEMLAP